MLQLTPLPKGKLEDPQIYLCSRRMASYCHAIQLENALKRVKILEVHKLEKTEKPLQILYFLRFSELTVKSAFMFPKP